MAKKTKNKLAQERQREELKKLPKKPKVDNPTKKVAIIGTGCTPLQISFEAMVSPTILNKNCTECSYQEMCGKDGGNIPRCDYCEYIAKFTCTCRGTKNVIQCQFVPIEKL